MTRISRFLAILPLLFSLAGCAKKDFAETASSSPPPVGAVDVKAATPLKADRALIVTMDVAITVDDVPRAEKAIRTSVERAGGYVADGAAFGSGSERSARLTLRIPNTEVRTVRDALSPLGDVTSDVEKVEDVTESRADLEARLRNARVQEKRLLEIMAQKTGAIGDLIAAESELSRVRGTIEQFEAAKRSLDGRIDLATIHVSLETRAAPAWHTPKQSIERAGSAGIRAAATFGVYVAMALAATAPFTIPIAAVVLALVFIIRKRRLATAAALVG